MWQIAWNGSAAICKLCCDTTLQLILDAANDIYKTNKEQFIHNIYP